MSAIANQISSPRLLPLDVSEPGLPLSTSSAFVGNPTEGFRGLPDKVITHWQRFSSGLWGIPQGDISAAYCADTFPRIRVFNHNGVFLTNCGGCFSGPATAWANCYPLIPANDYQGPEPRRYTYEGCEARYRGKTYKLGPKIVFVASDATIEEWRRLFRVRYAEGGWFARQSNYELFLNDDDHPSKSENAPEALRLELTSNLITYSKGEMKCLLDGEGIPQASKKLQLDLAL